MEGRFVSYLRVSTAKQGIEGLGIEGQRKAISDYLNGGRWKLLREYIEQESGKRTDNRPVLAEALAYCKRARATLLISKLDRLSRSVATVSALMESGIEFVAVDMPHANRLTLHILAAMAEYEREMVSKRTKAALEAARARGIRLGSPVGLTEEAAKNGRIASAEGRKKATDEYAERMKSIIQGYQEQGMSLNQIARKLSEDEEPTPRGKDCRWTATTVRNVLLRVGKGKE